MSQLTSTPIPKDITRKNLIERYGNRFLCSTGEGPVQKLFLVLLCVVMTIILAACWPPPPPPPCQDTPCPDLSVQVLSGTQGYVVVRVTNFGNKASSRSATLTASFSRIGWGPVSVESEVQPLAPGASWETSFAPFWNAPAYIGPPESLIAGVFSFESEPDKGNNTSICSWDYERGRWSCSNLSATVVTQSGTSESTTSNSVQLLESKKEPLNEILTAPDLNDLGGFTGMFAGRSSGIDDTSAPFGVEFVGSMISTDFLPGMKLSFCGSSGPIYPFIEAANVTVTGNHFTTGPLETNNDATVILSGNLSDEGQTLNLSLKVDPEDCDSKTIAATMHRVHIPMDLTLELGSHPSGVFVGQNLDYAVNIKNDGQVTAQDAILYVNVPSSLTLIKPSGISCTSAGDRQVCSIPIARIDPGNSRTLDFSFDTINVKTKVLTTSFELVVEGEPTLDIAPSDNVLDLSHSVTFVSDFSVTDFELVNPPTTLFVGEDTMITLSTTVKNDGPSSPISAVLSGTTIAPADSKSMPNEPTIDLPDLATSRTVEQTYTVNCGEVSDHTFSFTAEIQPLDPADMDPDLSNNKATTSLTVECIFRVNLSSAGWHLFSMPVVPQDMHTDVFLNEIAGQYSMVLSFKEGGLSYDPALPNFSTLTTMDGKHGYWIYMEQGGSLNVRGQPLTSDTPVSLAKGWNLVSYLPRTPLPVSQALVSIAGKYDKVLGYDHGATSYYAALQPPLNTLQVMERGKGYWIHMTEAGVLNYAQASSMVQSAAMELANQPQYIDRMAATSQWINVYSTNSMRNGVPLPVGTTVTAIGEDGRMLGQVMVREPGWYGVLAVYGADGSDSEFRGTRAGEEIRFLIDGKPATVVNGHNPVWTNSGDLFQVDLEINGESDSHNIFLPNVQR